MDVMVRDMMHCNNTTMGIERRAYGRWIISINICFKKIFIDFRLASPMPAYIE
jgi:hypothetical protein